MHHQPQRGFTLLIAVVLSGVILSLSLALLDIAYKQIVLSSTAKQSQYAFYNADSALECILYYDQTFDAFNANPTGLTQISCNGRTIDFSSAGSVPKVTLMTIPCVGTGATEAAYVEIYKGYATLPSTRMYATGYSTCNSTDTRRIERGVKVLY